MILQESGEMYLETIYRLSAEKPLVRAIDVGEQLGYSKPSVSRAVGVLKAGGYLLTAENGGLVLTEAGRELAEKIYQRHTLLTRMLTALGVEASVAAEDACRMEHIISDETFLAIKRHFENE